MSLPGPFPVTQTGQPSLQDLAFHLNEHVNAQVIQVYETQAVLEINGYPVVAKLTSKEQAAELLSHRSADFIITQWSADQITLKFNNPSGAESDKSIQVQTTDLAMEIAKNIGLQGTDNEVQLIRLALLEHLPVTKEMVSQLLEAIDDSGINTATGIGLAVKLKAAGLPVTPESMQLVGKFSDLQTADAFRALLAEFQNVLAQFGEDQPLSVQVQNATQYLNAMIPDLSTDGDTISAGLQELFRFLGKPYERLLSEQVDAGHGMGKDPFDLITLAQLGKEFRQSGQSAAANYVERFLELVRQNQFMNIKPDEVSGKGQWSEVTFCVQGPADKGNQTYNAKVRISYRPEESSRRIDSEYTNLVLQVDLESGKEVEFNLSIYQKKVDAEVSSNDTSATALFKESLPEFGEVLNRLGYNVVHAAVHLRQAQKNETSSSSSTDYPVNGNLVIEV